MRILAFAALASVLSIACGGSREKSKLPPPEYEVETSASATPSSAALLPLGKSPPITNSDAGNL